MFYSFWFFRDLIIHLRDLSLAKFILLFIKYLSWIFTWDENLIRLSFLFRLWNFIFFSKSSFWNTSGTKKTIYEVIFTCYRKHFSICLDLQSFGLWFFNRFLNIKRVFVLVIFLLEHLIIALLCCCLLFRSSGAIR